MPADDSLSQYVLSATDGAIELESPALPPARECADSSEAVTKVATVVVVLNVPKLAEVLSPLPKLGANREDWAVVAVV